MLTAVGVPTFAARLRAKGIRSARSLEEAPKSELRQLLGDECVDALFLRRGVRARSARQDVPVVHPYARGSARSVQSVAGEPATLARLDEEFQRDKYASSSSGPRDSRWKTWCMFAGQRGLPPLPVTPDLVDKVGALFKFGRYRSAAQYFAVAKSLHRAAGHEWNDRLDFAVQQATRSIVRGMGPSAIKRDVPLERVSNDFAEELEKAYDDLRVPVDQRMFAPADTVGLAAWFLLRGLEMATVRCEDVALTRSGEVRLHLPVPKTDPSAKGCHRSHICLCDRRHDPDCRQAGDVSALFTSLQRCACSTGRHPLCPYHAALRMSVELRRTQRWNKEAAFIRDRNGEAPSKTQLAYLARVAAKVLLDDALMDWPIAALQRWSQHTFRVAGSQLFARAGLDVSYIMLLGRWGSAAILRYIQEAALAEPARAAAAVARRTSVLGDQAGSNSEILPSALEQIRSVVAECLRGQGMLVHNVRSKLAHKPCAGASAAPSDEWVSACGKWRYGRASCQRNPNLLPGFKLCDSCFPEQASLATAVRTQHSVREDSQSSSASED